MTEGQSTRMHRIVRENPPSLDDFASKAQLGIPCPVDDADVQDRWSGLSLFGSGEQARRVVRRLPMLGQYIAALDLPAGSGLRMERTPGPGSYSPGVVQGREPAGVGPAQGDMGIAPVPAFHHEIWELASRSLVATYPDEAEALSLVGQLMASGWSADDLVLAAENEGMAVEDLPPSLTGEALIDRLSEDRLAEST